jgi:O-antigen/teichoic acid export membrane protein
LHKRDFSGNSGQAIKNSSYQLATTIIAKVGSLLFTIILARMLMPELFGLYSLALGTIILFGSFSDLGIGSALVVFVSKALSKKDFKKAKAYYQGLLKYKIYLVAFSSFALLISAYFISNYYYNKPIFYALLAGGLYLPVGGILGYLEGTFRTMNLFRYSTIKELIFQILRITLVPIGILYLFKTNLEPSLIVAGIILILSFCYLIALIFIKVNLTKKALFLKEKTENLTTKEKKKIKKFILPLSVTALSGMFFGYIDTLMLGHYVESTYIGYYGAAFGLIGAASALLSFIPAAVFPIFSRLKEKSLEKMFKKIRNVVVIISILVAIFTFFLAQYILLVYGQEYLPATIFLKTFSILIIILPLIGLYNSYFISQEKTKLVAKLLIISTLINIALNWTFISYGLKFGMMEAVLGACIATIISRVFYLGGFVLFRKRKNL